MAAPEGIVWGSTVGGYGRIGIYKKVSSTDTTTTVTVEVWFWSKYSVSDANNQFYYDNLSASGSATTFIGANSVKTTVDTGEGWSTSNQVKLYSKTHTYDRGTSAVTRYLYAKQGGIDRVGGWMYASTTFTIPALPTYTVTYNANGGSGAPAKQTKTYGKTLTLSSTKPTLTGHTFKGWALTKADADDGKWYYQPGGSCGRNENLTLYAVWEAYTYTVKYNANGGSGAPANQTKTYGATLKLSTTKPTRTNYEFLGWAKSASATKADYASGGNYTTNAAVTLYAVWKLAYVKPIISNLIVYRCDSNGNITDDGTSMKVAFDFECTYPVTLVRVSWGSTENDRFDFTDPVDDGLTSYSIDAFLSADRIGAQLDPDQSYEITVIVADQEDESTAVFPLSSAAFPIDILAEDKGVAFGKSAELEDVADFAFKIKANKGFINPILPKGTDLNNVREPNTYIGLNVSSGDPNYGHCPLTSGTFTLEVMSSGEEGQVLQRLTRCYKLASTTYERFYYSGAWGEWTGDWITAEITGPFGNYNDNVNHAPKYRKDGRLVEVRGIVTPSEDIAFSTEHNTIFTLPEGYRPSIPLYILCQGTGNCVWLLRINTNGAVGFARYRNGDTNTTASAGVWLPFQATFLV